MNEEIKKEEKWIILGVSVIFFVGALLHFAYEFSGNNKLIGLFVPVNESVWEHLKMLILPTILWWLGFYYFSGEKLGINADRWFTATLVSLVTSMVFMVAFFYTYTGALGFESIAVDILDTFLSVLAGQLAGLHFYRYSKGMKWWIALTLIILIVILFAVFTINPPHLPIFLDSVTKTYGIQ